MQFSSAAPLWLGLVIGNSRYYWGQYAGASLQQSWHTPHLSAQTIQPLIQQQWDFASCWACFDRSLSEAERSALPTTDLRSQLLRQIQQRNQAIEVWLASVVPAQTELWQDYPGIHSLSLADVPLINAYPSLGIDRALALWGAGETYGWPILVIDAGTALTLTGGNPNRELVGGAILPGLNLQRRALAQGTAALNRHLSPRSENFSSPCLPQRWALDTTTAIESGAIYTTLAGLQDFLLDWWRQFPKSIAILTGGDCNRLHAYLQQQFPQIASQVALDANIIFQGIQLCQAKSIQ